MRKGVLIVEDGEADVRAIKAALRDGNLSNPVAWVATGNDARDLFIQEATRGAGNLGIVMLNIRSSRVCGLEFLDWLREQDYFSELLVVALAERSQLRDVVKAYERGAHTFVVKPVHMEDVKALAKNYPEFCAIE